MKPTRKRTPSEVASIAAEKEKAAAVLCRIYCKKIGAAVSLTFLREIKKAHGCGDENANEIFNEAVKRGEIVEAWERGGVKVYEMKETRL